MAEGAGWDQERSEEEREGHRVVDEGCRIFVADQDEGGEGGVDSRLEQV